MSLHKYLLKVTFINLIFFREFFEEFAGLVMGQSSVTSKRLPNPLLDPQICANMFHIHAETNE